MRIVPATRPTTFSTKKNECPRTPSPPPPPPTPPLTPPPQSPTIPVTPPIPLNDSSLSPTISSSLEKPTITTTTLSQRRHPNQVKRMSNMMTTAVFIKDDKIGWKPAQLLSRDENGKTARVLVSSHPLTNYSIDYIKRTTPRRKIFRMASARQATTTTSSSSLSPPLGGLFNNKSLSLRNVNSSPNDSSSPPRSPSPLSSSSSSSFDDDNDNDTSPSLSPRTISLTSYENDENDTTTTLPLQDVDEWGNVISRDDLTDVPYLNEGTILWNLATRHEREMPYTRAGVVICAVNPQRWIEGLYSEERKVLYADSLVWNPTVRSLEALPPHVYEASSLAYRGLVIDGEDQSILVSGESGAGKTETVKILMNHLATFEATKLPLDDDDDDDVVEYNKLANKNQRQEGLSSAAHSKRLSRKGSVRKLMRKLASFKSKRHVTKDITIEETTTHTQEDSSIQSPPPTPLSARSSSSSSNDNVTNTIIQRVLSSNPLLEAFGNAKTSRNDNSSRFSKYTRLQFRRTDDHHSSLSSTPYALAGSICDTYLLQKSRIVHHFRSRGERTFHVMYMLLAAGEEETTKVWKGLKGKTPEDYRYVGEPSTDLVEGETDAERWMAMRDALRSFDVSEDDYVALMRCLCVVLQLGNVSFESETDLDASSLRRDVALDGLCDALGVSCERLEEGLSWKTMVTRGETFRLARNEKAAREAVDALAKEIYSQTFDWLVGMINEKTRATATTHRGACRVIGLLDIFGFETFETNYFEQLCINHANEKLQQKFTRDVFGTVRREYQEEGIDLENVQFQDNTEVLDLMEGKMGLIDLLNEECVMPGGSDVGFVRKVYGNVAQGGDLPLFKKKQFQRHQFGINHYAGQVVYDATHFVSKNIDALPEEIIQCAIQTNNHIIKSQFQKLLIEKKQLKKTLWTKFRTQLSELMTDIGKSHSRYVRCIVPNKEKKPYVTHFKYVLDQLRYAGVLSAIAMSRSTFPNRMSHEVAIDRFSMLRHHPAATTTTTVDNKHGTKNKKKRRTTPQVVSQPSILEQLSQLMDQLLSHLKTISIDDDDDQRIIPAYSLGKTRIYFRAGALECLEEQRLLFFNKMATVIQSAMRRKRAMERYEWLKKQRAASVTKDKQGRRRKGGGNRMVRLKKKVWVMFRKPAVLGGFFRVGGRGRNGNRRKSITVGVQ